MTKSINTEPERLDFSGKHFEFYFMDGINTEVTAVVESVMETSQAAPMCLKVIPRRKR